MIHLARFACCWSWLIAGALATCLGCGTQTPEPGGQPTLGAGDTERSRSSPSRLPEPGGQPTLGAGAVADGDMSPFKCVLQLEMGEHSATSQIYFQSHYAVEFNPEDPSQPDVIFDLKDKSWRDFDPSQQVSWEECQSWTDSTTEATRKQLAASDNPEGSDMIKHTLDPDFQVSTEGETVVISNPILTYRVSEPMPLDELQQQRFITYDRLNAYRKAMLGKKLPPFPQLAVDDVLEERKIAPGRIEFRIIIPGGEVKGTVESEKEDLTPNETEKVNYAIASAQGS